MDLDRYKADDLQRDQRQLESLKQNLLNLLRIKYAAVVALLVSAFYNNNPIITLFPLFISFVIFFIEISYRKKICRNAAYLIVFYGKEIAPEWESRFHEHRKKFLQTTRAKEFLKNFSRIKATRFLNFKIFIKFDKLIVRFFFVFLSETSSLQNFYIVELLFIAISSLGISVNYCCTLGFPIDYCHTLGLHIDHQIMLLYMLVIIFNLIILKTCFFFGKVFYNYKIDYEKKIDEWIEKWGKVKADEKLKVSQELLSKFANNSSMQSLVKNIVEQNSNLNDRSLELLNNSLQLSMKTIVLTRLLELNPDYKNIKDEEELKALLEIWKKLY